MMEKTSCDVVYGCDYRSGKQLKVTISEGIIRYIEEHTPSDGNIKQIIAPGLVDLQVNGFAGIDLNSSPLSYSAVRELAARLWSEGVTTFFPTVITNSEANIFQSVKSIAEACSLYPEVRMTIGGIHLEGPFISPEEGPRGAHPAEFIQPPNWELFCRWQEASEGLIKLVTLSPEWPLSGEFIKKCVRSGIIVAIGHTAATPDAIRSAVESGATMSTHLGNASHQMLPRHRNYLWEQLAADELFITMISDGFHIPDAMLKIFLKVKPEKTILVSDSTMFAGMKPGNYSTHIGGNVTLTDTGKLHIQGKPDVLAGSGLPLLHCVNTLIQKNLLSPAEAWELASIRPAAFIGNYQCHSFSIGAPADIVIMELNNTGYRILKTIKSGKTVFERVHHSK